MQGKNENENKRCKKRGKLWFCVVAVILGVGITASFVGCGRHHWHGNSNPERIEKMVMWKVDDTLDDLDATDAQRAEIEGIAREILADAMKIKEGHGDHKTELYSKFSSGTYDRTELHGKVDEHFELARAFVHRSLDRVMDAYETLDEKQRQEILDRWQEHMDEH
ncbi:MAG: periplasmic heavy metal sensor [Proteobacteria bacterium]|nr:periplasmic heavy metal sensor [Pseudomonadota bacterium]